MGTLIVTDSGCFVFTDQVACNDNSGAYLVLRVFFCSLAKFISVDYGCFYELPLSFFGEISIF